MAEEEQQTDEYQFADMDSATPGTENPEERALSSDEKGGMAPPGAQSPLRNRILIGAGAFILVIIFLKLFGFFSKKEVIPPKPPVTMATAAAPIVQPPAPVIPTPTNVAPLTSPDVAKVNDQLKALESTQQTMQSNVSAVNAQVGEVNKSVQSLLNKMTELNQVIANLSVKVDQQSREIEALTVKREAQRKPPPVARRMGPRVPVYYLQAVIPGRAWLIATNGATLTVREGSALPGYGVVKLIDATEGRVMTSSGQVIRFAQNDS